MIIRLLLILVIAFSGISCESLKKGKDKKKKPPKSIEDVSGDVSFQSFISRLRTAVKTRDMSTVASLMTPDFGYLMDPIPGDLGSGEGVFRYWDNNNIWPELNLIIQEKFVPFGNYMVAPAQFSTDTNYDGYRAGIINQNGSWKFAYFVKGPQS